MGEIILSIVGVLVIATFEPTTRQVGRHALNRRGITASWYVELLVGISIWSLLGLAIFIMGAFLVAYLNNVHHY
jgi:hypothetical protein